MVAERRLILKTTYMKKLLLIFVIGSGLISCSKDDETTHCYDCMSYAYSKFEDGREKYDTIRFYHCDKTQSWIDKWVKDYGTHDGPYWSVKPGEDTVHYYYRVKTNCPQK